MKILVAILATILVLAIAAIGVAIFWVDTSSFKTQLENTVENVTGKPLQIEGIPEISIFPLGFKLGAAYWGYRDGKPNQYGISAAIKSSSVSIALLPLFSKNIVINSIILVEPKINIFREKSTQTKATVHVESATLDNKTENFAVELKNVRVENASIVLKNVQGMHIDINGLNANIKNLSPNELGTIEINTNINLEQIKQKQTLFAGNVALKTSIMFNEDMIIIKQANANVNVEKSTLVKLSEPLKLSATAVYFIKTKKIELGDIAISSNFTNFTLKNKVSPASLGSMGEAVNQNAGAVDLGKADNTGFLGNFTLNINLEEVLKILQINMPDKQIPKDLSLVGILNYDKNNIYIKDIKGKIDNTSIIAYLNILSYNVKEKMNVMGEFNLGKINVDPYMLKSAKIVQKDLGQGQKSEQEVKQEVNIVMPKGLPDMNLIFNIDSLSIKSIVLKNIQGIIINKSGIYRLQPVKFSLATGGTLSSRVASNSKNNSYDISIRADKVNVGSFLQALQGNSKASGIASFDAELKTAGTNIPKLKDNLSGTGQFRMQNITLNNLPLILKTILGNNIIPTKFDELSMSFVSKKGIITVNPIRLLEKKAAKTQKFGGLGNGIINLPVGNIKLRMNVKLDKVNIPILISGPFSEISYGLDAEKVAQKVLKGTINNTVNSLKKGEIDKNTIINIFKGIMEQ